MFSKVDLRECKIPRSLALSDDGSILKTAAPFQYGTIIANKGTYTFAFQA